MKQINSSDSKSDESDYESEKENPDSTAKSSAISDSIEEIDASTSNAERSSDHVEFTETDDEKEERESSSEEEEERESSSDIDRSSKAERHNSFIDRSADASSDEEEDVIRPKRKSRIRVNRITDDDTDEEELSRRKTIYELEPEGDMSIIVEDAAYSKSIRKSIQGFLPKQLSIEVKDEPISGSEDSDIIISSDGESDSEDEDDEEKENLDYSGMISKKLSSTIRSPLKASVKLEPDTQEESFNNNSLRSQRSSSMAEIKNESLAPLKKVSRASYDREVAEKESLVQRIATMKKLLEIKNGLPDGGQKLRESVTKIENELREKERAIQLLIIDDNESIKNSIKQSFTSDNESFTSEKEKEPPIKDFMAAQDVQPKYTGKVGLKNFEQQKALTVEKLKDIHASLDQRPGDDVLAAPPKHLKLELMKHQLHANAFMEWRETQRPRGGILADDMGLGKTLTMIAFVLKQLQAYEERDENDPDTESDEDEKREEDAWIAHGHRQLRRGGTLVICPASLMAQWEQEIKTRVKSGALNVTAFHGPKRETRAKKLAEFDIVITTYQIVLSEHKSGGCLFGVKWDRIVLDEGHVIRNYRSKQSEAVCALLGSKRWVLTGTPIQNKEFDIYAAIKFLRCSPFDDLRYWRTWIETKKGSSPRLQALLKSILLRRTKQQLQDSGEIQSLPEKHYEQVNVVLNREERSVYNRMLVLSKQIFAQFLQQHQDKHNNYTYDNNNLGKLHQKFAKILKVDHEIKPHEILTLLLRLRQMCCHPGLVKSMIEQNDFDTQELGDDGRRNSSGNDSDIDILRKLQDLKIGEKDESKGELQEDTVVTPDNKVFDMTNPSSKIEQLLKILRKKLIGKDDKAIIVSQWVSHLNIIKGMLENEGIHFCELNGSVPVKFRNDIVVEFNRASSSVKVMLLSITAGGVGLNLVGANQLYVMDPHWNPQIEAQAQDRIYRFGQTKDVKIVKFICEDTIEEKILKKQEEKLELAKSTLTGAKRSATKLTIEDLKDMFGMK